jgi:restriction system protein
MARRTPSFLDALAQAPWPIGLIAGAAVWVAAHVLPAVLGSLQNPYLSALGMQLASGALKPLFWVLAGVCWLAALISLLGRKQRQQLLEAQSGPDTLRAMSWRELELLVSEAYRRQGYQVQETGQGGADGGIDLVLLRDGRVSLVQCKHWRTRRVGAPVVREQFGLLTHHQAAAVIIVTTGDFTPEAKAFAEGKPIELMAGPALLALVRSVQRQATSDFPTRATSAKPGAADPPEPTCPTCASPMVRRTARKTKTAFFGCSRFPACRGTRSI